ncbi:protein TIME FOR COFFEE isoform X2 [Humulus lupulus]|uniref:protein TIME FOR COFFEE isoform X2 n=1 Tax=Humulus lupulus TaxID=3486 RepID=UPI002B40DE22|nr:protein TIME FOR COFFEE isoform X2 [Humulus lupulus]
MDRNREARRASMAATNGLSRRRHRTGSLRDSPEEDGPVELQETARLRDRGSGKKDRDRDRDRERERERDRDRDRERDRLNRSKRRRGDRMMHGNREDGVDDSSEESVNDEEEDEDDDGGAVGGGSGSLRMLPPPNPPASLSTSSMLHHQRKSFPPAKNFRGAPAWKVADEMIGVSVPRKARSVSTKRSHEWSSAIGIVGEQIHRQASTSPVRPSVSAVPTAGSQAPVSPSSSNASVRKKLSNGPKLRQPKTTTSSSKSPSAQDEIEIEIAEVLYGMMRQPQGPTKQDIMNSDSIKFESREANHKSTSEANKSSSDAKSRVSSPISSSQQYGVHQSSSRSSLTAVEGAVPAWAFCVAPKRKKPRLVKGDSKYEDTTKSSFLTAQNNLIPSASRLPVDQTAKTETSSANLEKAGGSAAENGVVSSDTAQSHAILAMSEAATATATAVQPEPIKLENSLVSESKLVSEKIENRDLAVNKEEPQSPKKEFSGHRLEDKRETTTATKPNSTTSEVERQREEKFQIDLMAPPPSRSSPERDVEIDFVAVDAKAMTVDTETEIKPVIKEDAKALKISREETSNVEPEKVKATTPTPPPEEAESKKHQQPTTVGKERNIDLRIDLEKVDRDAAAAAVVPGNKQHHHVPRQQQQQLQTNEKNAQSGALPMAMSMAGWPSGLSPMGYMAPLQGVVSMDGTSVSSAAIQPPPYLFTQPRPKRCATHCYIARSICCHQQIARMNSFWPAAAAAAGSGSLYGAKPCNLNVLPSPDLHGSIPGRGLNSVQDKGQGLPMFPGHAGKDKSSQAASVVDAAQRKQIMLQQALPPGAPSNILQGPAIIFPLSQQQAVAAASVRPPGSVKSPPAPGNANTSSASNPTPATAPAMTFNYPAMSGNETQYLAINAYPFPIPAHVGAPPAYRGSPQAMPFFNGSFYSTFHPSQLQQQQLSHSQQSQQGHQNPSISSGSSSSQKHLQNQQQRPPHPSGGVNGGGSLQGYPTSKNQSSQPLQLQQQQQRHQQNQHVSHAARQLESEMGGEDSPSTADSRVSRPSMSIYGQNFTMPLHASNFALMAPASIGNASGPNGAGGSNGEKKQQQQGSKGGVEPPHAFAMSFAPINGATTAPGIDISSIAQQQAILTDVRQGYQYMAVPAAQQKKNYRGPEEGKNGGDSSNVEEERKNMAGKGSSTLGQSIAFSRPDLSDVSGSTMPGSSVVDSSARTINLGSTQQRPGSVMTATSNAQQQLHRTHQQQQLQQQQQQMLQIQKHHQQQQQQQQQQFTNAASRSKTPATSNGSVYSDHHNNSSMAAKFPNALSTFPSNLVHSNNSPAHSPQWKNSGRSTTSQAPSPTMTSSTSSSLKNLPQQQGRTQQTHTQISFAANPKQSGQSQGLQNNSSNQSPSPPIMVGSPTTSSVSKSAGGSPRTTTSTSTANKVGQASSLSSQQAKNSPSVSNMKSSPGAGKNVPSILGNPHITSSSSTGSKNLMSQQQQQQMHSKHSLQHAQHAQLYFSYNIQNQTPHSNSNTPTTAAAVANAGAYYSQRRRPEQQQQQQHSGPGTSSSGMLTLCPSVSLGNTSTSDPAKAVAAAAAVAAGNMKGGGLPSQALMHPQYAAAQSGNPHQLLPAGFPYVHAVPTAVQVKPAEQKQPAGE